MKGGRGPTKLLRNIIIYLIDFGTFIVYNNRIATCNKRFCKDACDKYVYKHVTGRRY